MEALPETASLFPSDYAIARENFRAAAAAARCELFAHPIDARGPLAEELTIDVAIVPGTRENGTVLVISSGLHGVEGYFGSAVQLGLLRQWAGGNGARPEVRCVLLHALNPFGFAWRRRFNEDNFDLNRNLLVDGESFDGCPDGYRKLDALLNPAVPPSRWEPVALKLMLSIARHGMPAFKQAVASGQYEYPQGLFFGGARRSKTNEILAQHFDRWLAGSRRVMHIDFHTGLGPWAGYKLLIDRSVGDEARARLGRWFGAGSLEVSDPQGVSYNVRGGFGEWCVARNRRREYLYAAAEFGTYRPTRVLAGLRAENQAYHWGKPGAAATLDARRQLEELFCPRSDAWRNQVLQRGFNLASQALRGLSEESADATQAAGASAGKVAAVGPKGP